MDKDSLNMIKIPFVIEVYAPKEAAQHVIRLSAFTREEAIKEALKEAYRRDSNVYGYRILSVKEL
jgi:hypothetical protein